MVRLLLLIALSQFSFTFDAKESPEVVKQMGCKAFVDSLGEKPTNEREELMNLLMQKSCEQGFDMGTAYKQWELTKKDKR